VSYIVGSVAGSVLIGVLIRVDGHFSSLYWSSRSRRAVKSSGSLKVLGMCDMFSRLSRLGRSVANLFCCAVLVRCMLSVAA
jgi:hypothetical protein